MTIIWNSAVDNLSEAPDALRERLAALLERPAGPGSYVVVRRRETGAEQIAYRPERHEEAA